MDRQPQRAGWSLALAGATAVGVALAAGELTAAAVPGIPSPVLGVGTAIIEAAPGWLERGAIEVLGAANKLVLNVGIIVVALGVGALLGLAGRARPRLIDVGFVAFGLLGLAALLLSADAPLLGALLVTACAVGAGVGALRVLVTAAPVPRAAADRRTDLTRRRFVRTVAGAGAAAVVSAAAGRMLLQRVVPVGVDLPPAAEPAVAPPPDLPVQQVSPFVTPISNFFRIDTNLILPSVDPASWRLRIHGMVDREVRLSLDELLEMPLVERWVTIVCVSNPVGGDLVGNAVWTGVPLRELLDRAGVDEEASQLVGRSVDGWTAGFPTELAYDGRDALVAVGMNGEPLPRRHGAPARLVVAGLYGYVSATKWLEGIELTRWEDYDAYWVRRDWAKEGPVKIASRIDVPREAAMIDAGPTDIAGVAWATEGGVAGVEVTTDGERWAEAELGPSVSGHAWRQWRHAWDAPPGEHHLAVRAVGEDGVTQTAERATPFPDGATGHHVIAVTVR